MNSFQWISVCHSRGISHFEKASDLRDLAKQVPIEKLLLETDGPYLTPVPHRGQRNEPAYVENLLELYSEMYGLSTEDVARVTTHNANQLFSLGLEASNTAVYANKGFFVCKPY